jgi:hypothetical protein
MGRPRTLYAKSGDVNKALVAGSGIELVERGEHELKGVPGSWRLYAATGL